MRTLLESGENEKARTRRVPDLEFNDRVLVDRDCLCEKCSADC